MIRRLRVNGYKPAQLASLFAVAQRHINRICVGMAWSETEGPKANFAAAFRELLSLPPDELEDVSDADPLPYDPRRTIRCGNCRSLAHPSREQSDLCYACVVAGAKSSRQAAVAAAR